MDLIKELEKLNNNISHEEILEEFNQEKIEIDKKMHIIKVLSIAKNIDEYIKMIDFKAANIGGFEINCCEEDNGQSQSISLAFYRLNNELMSHDWMRRNNPEILQKIREIFNGSEHKSLKDLCVKSDFLSSDFIKNGWEDIFFEEDAGEQIINSLLSKELKSILEFSQMQLELNDKKEPTKKLKV